MRYFYAFLGAALAVSLGASPSGAEPRDYAIDPTKLYVEEKIAHFKKSQDNLAAWTEDYASRKGERDATLASYASAQNDHLGDTISTAQAWADDYASRKGERQATTDRMNERQRFVLTRWTETHRRYMGETN